MTSQRQKNAGFLLPEPLTGYPLTCVKFQIPDEPRFREAVRGLVYFLASWWNWEKSYQPGDVRARDAAKIFRNLLDQTFTIGEDCDVESSGCLRFLPSAPFVSYDPNNPYSTPDYTPPEYLFPPFYVQTGDISLVGASAGDVVTDIARAPTSWLPGVGYPRFRVNLQGTGKVLIELVTLYQGGLAQVQVDGDVLTLKYIDVNRDTTSLPPENYEVMAYRHEFTTPGDHFIDITFIPAFGSGDFLLGYGGGLRSIELCGFDTMFEDLRPEFQFTEECGMEYRYGEGEWIPVPGWAEFALACFAGAPGEPGEPGIPGEPGANGAGYDNPLETADPDGAPSDDKRCRVATAIATGAIQEYDQWIQALLDVILAHANDANAAFEELRIRRDEASLGTGVAGYAAYTIPGASWAGFWMGVAAQGVLGIAAIFAGVTALLNGHEALDLLQLQDDLDDPDFKEELICLIVGNLGETGSLSAPNWQDIRDAIPSLTAGDATMKARFQEYLNTYGWIAKMRTYALRIPASWDCSQCVVESEHYYSWDFLPTDGGWGVTFGGFGEWEEGVGWKAKMIRNGVQHSNELRIGKGCTNATGRTIVRVEVDSLYDRGQGASNFRMRRPGASAGDIINTAVEFDGEFVRDTPLGDGFRASIDFLNTVAYRASTGGLAPNPTGDNIIRSVRIWYNGPNANFTGGYGY